MYKLVKIVIFISLSAWGSSASAENCAVLNNWVASQAYTGGNKVQLDGNAYQANWWTQGNSPATESGPQGSGKPWTSLGNCDGGLGNLPPVAVANGPYTAVSGSSISFNSSGSNDPDGQNLSYAWTFGDGASSTQANPSHTYAAVGGYSAVLTVIDNDGATAGANAEVTIDEEQVSGNCNGLPNYVAGQTYSKDQRVARAGKEYRCDVAGWCSSSAAWAYAPGTGTYWSDAWTEIGLCGDTNENIPPVANSNGAYTGKINTSISFSSTGSSDSDGSIVSYAWDFGDGGSSTDQNPSHSYGAIGNFTVSLTVVDNNGASTSDTTSASVTNDVAPPPPSSGKKVIGYFAEWGVYGRNYHVKNLVTSGSADKLTHIMYAFGNVTNGQCVIGDSYADYDKFYDANGSVDGVADTWDAGALRGSFNQLRKLKAMYPNIKVVWSFGGWTWSGGFGAAAANPAAFAESCYNLVNDPRWAGVFDGIDIDWEYPNACGLSCDSSGAAAYPQLMQALRARFGNQLVTAAISADSAKHQAADYAQAAQYMDFYMLMTYDFFGAFAPSGPTAAHSALTSYPQIPANSANFQSTSAVNSLKGLGVPSDKILLGIGFYGRGWKGVTQSTPGGSANGAAPGTYEAGIEDYKVLKQQCPATGSVGGSSYALCGGNWWSYDTPNNILNKMNYVNQQNLGGAFFWEFSGDTANGELIKAISDGL
ncbi:MAG: chitinase [Arenicella sp.]|jgi:chitinase